MVDMEDVKWTGGLWAERFDVLQDSMIPYMWDIFQSETESHAWPNFLVAAGLAAGAHAQDSKQPKAKPTVTQESQRQVQGAEDGDGIWHYCWLRLILWIPV